MHLMLYRTYGAGGVNGELYIKGVRLCYTIELPWNNNQRNRSCIPEGTYVLKKRWSPKYKWHLEITGVRNRSFVLVHAANDAIKELRGCIAPVTILTGEGRGNQSRMALEKLHQLVLKVINQKKVLLTITTKR